MLLRLLPLLASFLIACEPKPDMQSGNVRVWWDGHPPLLKMLPAMNIIYQEGLAACPDPKRLQDAWCADVYWQDYPFKSCAGYDGPAKGYAGCQPIYGSCEVWVGWKADIADTALVDEVAHYIWEVCYGTSGEDCAKSYADGGYATCTEFGYDAFVSQVRQQIRNSR